MDDRPLRLELQCRGCGRTFDWPPAIVDQHIYCCEGCGQQRGCTCAARGLSASPSRLLLPTRAGVARAG